MANKYAAQSKIAQTERKRLSSCEGKKKFMSKEEAYQKNQDVYKCKFCDGWHRSGAMTKFIVRLNNRRNK